MEGIRRVVEDIVENARDQLRLMEMQEQAVRE